MPPKKPAAKATQASGKKSTTKASVTTMKAKASTTKSTTKATAKPPTKAAATKTATSKAATTKSTTTKAASSKITKTTTSKVAKAAKPTMTATAAKAKPVAPPKVKPAPEKPAASKKRKAASPEEEEDKENLVPTGRPTKRARAAKVVKAVKHEAEEVVVPAGPLNKAPAQVLDIFVFGTGENGELGLGPVKTEATRPRLIPALNTGDAKSFHVVDIFCGGMHTIALTKDNKIVTWGVNDNGALGRDTNWEGGLRDADEGSDDDSETGDLNPKESTPTAIPSNVFPKGTVFTQVAAGDSCSLALTEDGRVYGWGTFTDSKGDKMFGFDEEGNEIKVQPTPILIPGLTDVVQITCGANHALALDSHGTAYAWGVGEQSQLGRRVASRRQRTRAFMPQPIHTLEGKAKYISSGHFHSFVVDTHDNVWSWGLNSFGQTGYAKTAGKDNGAVSTPMKVASLSGKNVTSLDGGAHHSAAVTQDGKCYIWGRIDGGQLGIKFTDAQINDPQLVRLDDREKPRICLRPTEVSEVGSAVHVGCGTEHTVVVNSEGVAYSTGFGTQGQLGLGSYDDIDTFQQIPKERVKGKKLTWSGAGGQFSIVAAPVDA